jgi:flavin reductase
MAIDAELFKCGMRRLAAGVSVVTAIDSQVPHGLVATSVSSVCVEPAPTLLVCVNRNVSCHAVIQKAGAFCVNILRSSDIQLARRFSAPENRAARFDGYGWAPLTTGAPALLDALASFDCRVAQTIEIHSHTIFIGNVLSVRLPDTEIAPLLYLDGRFETLRADTVTP